MALIQDGRLATGVAAVETKTKSIRVTNAPRGLGFSVSGTSNTVAAAQAAAGCYWAIRNSPTSSQLVFVEKIRFQYTTIAAFTAPVTGGRRLSLFRGAGSATTGGTALSPTPKDSTSSLSGISSANGGDSRIATTATLSVTGITWEAAPIRELAITHVGTAGGNTEDIYDFSGTSPIVLQPGQVLGIRNINAMDAGGTWQISVDADYHESVAWISSTVD